MRLRQVVLVAADLEQVIGQLRDVFAIEVAYRDPDVAFFDLHNAVLAAGDTFIEVVSPLKDTAAAARYRARRGGDCGYMVMVQCDDFDRDRERVEALGIRIVWSAELDDISGMHLHPRDTGGPLLSLDQPRPAEAWRWAGAEWTGLRDVGDAREVVAAEIADPDPAARARRWGEILGRKAAPSGDAWRIDLDRGSLRFVAAASATDAGLTQIDLRVSDVAAVMQRAAERGVAVASDRVHIAGVDFNLRS